MKIQYCSDLHLEFSDNEKFLKETPLKAKGDILILAGDIIPLKISEKFGYFFDFLSDNFKYTYWIPGNHEYYYYDIADKGTVFNEKIRKNVFLVNNISVVHDNVKFIFSTLWSKIRPAYQRQIERRMSDFHVIKYFGTHFSASQYNKLHNESLDFIKQELKNVKEDTIIVATHHVPTFMNYPEQYKGDTLNDTFAVELFELIKNSDINYWIFGHHHKNIPEFKIGKTGMLTNQLGYVMFENTELFNPGKYFEID